MARFKQTVRAWLWWMFQIVAHIVLRLCLIWCAPLLLFWLFKDMRYTRGSAQASLDWLVLWRLRIPRPPSIARKNPSSNRPRARRYITAEPFED